MFRTPSVALAAAVLAAALLLPAPAAAQQPYYGSDTFTRFELTPFVGYRLDGELDDTDFGFAFSDFEPEVDESEVYGVSLGFGLNPNMLIEVLVNRQDTQIVFEPVRSRDERIVSDVELTTVHVGFVYQWRLGQADPYVVLSGGVTQFDEELADDEDTRFSGSVGGGVKLRFTDHLGLRLEGRMFLTDVDSEFGDDDRRRYDRDDALFQPEASAGLIFSF